MSILIYSNILSGYFYFFIFTIMGGYVELVHAKRIKYLFNGENHLAF